MTTRFNRLGKLLRRGGRSPVVTGGGGTLPVGGEAAYFTGASGTGANADTGADRMTLVGSTKPTGSMTFAFWLWRGDENNISRSPLSDWTVGTNTQGRWAVYTPTLTSVRFSFTFGGTGSDTEIYIQNGGTPTFLKTWRHVVVRKDGANPLDMWIDGVKESSPTRFGAVPATIPELPSQAITIGAWPSAADAKARPWRGGLGDFRIYATALSDAECEAIYADNPPSGAVVSVPFYGDLVAETGPSPTVTQGTPYWMTSHRIVTSPPAAGAIKILCAGDSNTQRGWSFRREMRRYLSGYYGRNVDLVGQYTTADETPNLLDGDIQHFGVSGQSATTQKANIAAEVTTQDPDVIVYMIGTNDANGINTASQIADEIEACVRNAHGAKSVPIVLATMYPSTLTNEADIAAANALLPGRVATMVGDGIDVRLIDTRSILTTRDLVDIAHLLSSSATKPGKLFADAVAQALGWS